MREREEAQNKQQEKQLQRALGLKLIAIGYKVLATTAPSRSRRLTRSDGQIKQSMGHTERSAIDGFQ